MSSGDLIWLLASLIGASGMALGAYGLMDPAAAGQLAPQLANRDLSLVLVWSGTAVVLVYYIRSWKKVRGRK